MKRRYTSLPRCGSCRLYSIFDAGSGPRNLNDIESEKREISPEKIVSCNFLPAITADDAREAPLLEERFLDARYKVQDCDSYQREANSRSGQAGACHEEKGNDPENLTESARLNGHRVNIKEGLGGNRRRRPGSRGRISLDFDSSTGEDMTFILSFCKIVNVVTLELERF